MLKTVAAGAAAFMIAAGAVAFAQQPPAGPDGGRRAFTAEDTAALLDARIAALHAGLRLSADQDKAWPAFEQAWRDLAALRNSHPSGAGDEVLDPVQRTQRIADALTTRGAALKRYADALEPLYKTLDDGQKRRLSLLSHHHRHRHHFAFWHGSNRGDFHGPRGEFFGPRGESNAPPHRGPRERMGFGPPDRL